MTKIVTNVETLLAQLKVVELVRRVQDQETAYQFKHALVQDTAYATLLRGDRKLIHRAVARCLASSYPQQLDEFAAQLAEHYWRGEDWAGAAEFSQRAGTNALRVYAMREAMSHFERARTALENVQDAPPAATIDAVLGWAQAAVRFRPYAEQLAQLQAAEVLARALGDKPRLAQILYRAGSAHMASGHNLHAAPIFGECFTLADELGSEALTVLPTYFMGTLVMDTDPRAAMALFERAVALAEKYHNADVLASAFGTQAMLYARLGEAETAKRMMDAAFDALTNVQSPMTESDVMLYAAWSWLEMGEVARGLETSQRGVDKALAAENMDCLCYGFACLGFAKLYSGDAASAQGAFQEAARRSHFSGALRVENLAASGWAMSKLAGGDTRAVPDLENAYQQATRLDSPFAAALAAQTLGEIFLQQNDLVRARAYLDSAYEYFERAGLRPYLERADTARTELTQAQDA